MKDETIFRHENRFWLALRRRFTHVPILLSVFTAALLLAACAIEINPDLPLDEIEEVRVSNRFDLLGSPTHENSELEDSTIRADSMVNLVAADMNYEYLLVEYRGLLGWMSHDKTLNALGNFHAPVVIEPLDPECTTWLSAMEDGEEGFTVDADGDYIFSGGALAPIDTPDLEGAILTLSSDGAAEVTISDYIHVNLTEDNALLLFTMVAQGAQDGDTFTLTMDPSMRPDITVRSGIFELTCDDYVEGLNAPFYEWVPIGEFSDTLHDPYSDEDYAPPTLDEADDDEPDALATPVVVVVEVPDDDVPARPNEPTGEVLDQLLSAIDAWDRVHHEVDRTLETDPLYDVLSNPRLQKQIDSLNGLRDANCYWDFSTTSPNQYLGSEQISSSRYRVRVVKYWYGEQFCNDRLQSASTIDQPFVQDQFLELTDKWRLYESQTVQDPYDPGSLPPMATSGGESDSARVSGDGGKVRLRAGPSTQFAILEELADGSSVIVLGRNEGGDWLKVSSPTGREGWAAASYITTDSSIGSYPVASTPSLNEGNSGSSSGSSCSRSVDARLNDLYRASLGCPTGNAFLTWASYTPFERGEMIWRRDTNKVYGFFNSGWWTRFDEQWDQVSVGPSRGTPPPGRIEPTGGSNWLWRTNDTMFNELGWALREHRGFCALVQHFDNGFVLRSNNIEFCQDRLYNTAREPTWPLDSVVAIDGGGWTWRYR